MYKKTITYEDYDGNKRTEDFYFNLNKSELTRWLSTTGEYTLDKVMMKLLKERNAKEIMDIMENLVKISYGEKSLDGRLFVKTEEVWNNFRYSEAFNELYYNLCTDAKYAGEFFNGIVPKELADKVLEEFQKNPDGIPAEIKDYIPKKE